MAITLRKQVIAYFPVPKVACTSIKHVFFALENDREFQPFFANGKLYSIHKIYPGKLFASTPRKQLKEHIRLAVVRDPVKRLLSCYSNRVVHHQELSGAKIGKDLREAKLTPNPDLGEFVDNLEAYQKVQGSVFHHSRPMVDFLGKQAKYYSKIYRIEEIENLIGRLNKITGKQVVLGRHQTGGPKLQPSDLETKQLEKLKTYYAEDYDAFGAYF